MQRQCSTLWYVAEHKLLQRIVHRPDPYPFHSAVTQPLNAAMKLCFYLNDDYAPHWHWHWHWLHHEFEKLPEAKALGPLLDRLLVGGTPQESVAVVPDIIELLTDRLAQEGWIGERHITMFQANGEIKAKITDLIIRDGE
jgi:hypothetical protein